MFPGMRSSRPNTEKKSKKSSKKEETNSRAIHKSKTAKGLGIGDKKDQL